MRFSKMLSVILLVVVGVLSKGGGVQARPSPPNTIEHTEITTGKFYCEPTEILELSHRIQVRCKNPWLFEVSYAAIDKSDPEAARRFVAFSQGALLSKKVLVLILPFNGSTNVSGCSASNCRTPTAFGLADNN